MTPGDWILIIAVIISLGIGLTSIITTRNIQNNQLKHTEKIQKMEYRHRYLSLIINWAIDIDIVNIPLTIGAEDAQDFQKLWFVTSNHISLLTHNNNQLLGKGRQMIIIASDFTEPLIQAVDKLNKALGEYGKRLTSMKNTLGIRKLDANLHEQYRKESGALIKYFWENVDAAAHEVIKESSKIQITS